MSTKRASAVGILIVALMTLVFACAENNPQSPNVAPTAYFGMNPTSGTSHTVFQFDASGSSDAEDTPSALQVRWDWENDGTSDTEWTATKTASHTYGTTGTWTIKLEVKDTGGLTDATTRTLTTDPEPVMALVRAGTFTMGDGVGDCGEDQHIVTLAHAFYLGKYEVTRKEYRDALQWAYDHGYVAATSAWVRDNLDWSGKPLVSDVAWDTDRGSLCQDDSYSLRATVRAESTEVEPRCNRLTHIVESIPLHLELADLSHTID